MININWKINMGKTYIHMGKHLNKWGIWMKDIGKYETNIGKLWQNYIVSSEYLNHGENQWKKNCNNTNKTWRHVHKMLQWDNLDLNKYNINFNAQFHISHLLSEGLLPFGNLPYSYGK